MKCEKCEDLINVLGLIARLLDNLTCECSSRVYTLDEDAMGDIYYCRDIAQIEIKDYNRKKSDPISEKEKESKLLLDQDVKYAAQQYQE